MRRPFWVLVPCLVAMLGVFACAPGDPTSCVSDGDCLGAQGCVSGQCLADGDENIAIGDNVRYVETFAGFKSVIVDRDSLIFEFDGSAKGVDVKVGDIVVGRGMDGHQGYLRHVRSTRVDGNRLILETAFADVSEAVSGKWSRTVRALDGTAIPFEPRWGEVILPGSLNKLEQPAFSGRADFAGKTLYEQSWSVSCGGDKCVKGVCTCGGADDCGSGYQCDRAACEDTDPDDKYNGVCRIIGTSTATVTVKLEFVSPSYIQIDPTFEVTSDSGWFSGLELFKVELGADVTADINVKASADLGLSHVNDDIPLFEASKSIWFGIGWFPVQLTITFKFLGGYSLEFNVGGSVTTGFDVGTGLRMGAEYRKDWPTGNDKEFRPIFTTHWNKNFHEPQWEAHGSITARVWVKPDIEALFYSQVGPGFYLRPRLNAYFEFLPKQCLKVWADLLAVIEFRLGIFEKLGLSNFTWTLFDNTPEPDSGAIWTAQPWMFYDNCTCTPKDHPVCDGNDQARWADDCDEIDTTAGGLIEDCPASGKKCVDGQCVPDGFGDLAGLVKDAQTNEPISGATIDIYLRDTLIDGGNLTSGSDGRYEKTHIAVGTYTLKIEKDGYIPATVVVNILDGEVTEVTPLRKLPTDCQNGGSASGEVVNAVTGEGVASATLKFREGVDVKSGTVVAEVEADADGNYTVSLPSGNYTAEASYTNFATTWFDIVVCGPDDWPNQNGAMSPLDDGNWRIVLTWGENPKDLDLHMVTPSIEGQPYHIFYRGACRGDRDVAPYADLDVDDRNSFGPETITISALQSGNYTFHVHNYGGQNDPEDTGTLSGSYARVQVYNPEGFRVRVFNVSGGGYWWNAFTLSGPDGNISQGASCSACVNPADFPDSSQCFP